MLHFAYITVPGKHIYMGLFESSPEDLEGLRLSLLERVRMAEGRPNIAGLQLCLAPVGQLILTNLPAPASVLSVSGATEAKPVSAPIEP